MNDQMLKRLQDLAEQAKRIRGFMAQETWAGPWEGDLASIVIAEITALRNQAQDANVLRQKVQQLEQRSKVLDLNSL